MLSSVDKGISCTHSDLTLAGIKLTLFVVGRRHNIVRVIADMSFGHPALPISNLSWMSFVLYVELEGNMKYKRLSDDR